MVILQLTPHSKKGIHVVEGRCVVLDKHKILIKYAKLIAYNPPFEIMV
jgi:hypothetical protein